MANLFRPEFDEDRSDREGFVSRRARVGRQLGTRRLGASVWELPPGEAAYPYHLHLGEEELLVVFDGTPDLRTLEGWRTLEAGEIVSFPQGEAGAHQLVNRSDATVRFLALSTHGQPDVVRYPDSGKVWAGERRSDGSGLRLVFRESDAVDYYEGESPPE